MDRTSREPGLRSESSEAKVRFADRLNILFELRRSRGKDVTPAELARATGLSEGYISLLRSGGIARPSAEKVQVLSEYFGVDPSWFTRQELPPQPGPMDADLEEAVRRVLSQPLVREVAFRMSEYGLEEQQTIVAMIESAHRLAEQARAKAEREYRATKQSGGSNVDELPHDS